MPLLPVYTMMVRMVRKPTPSHHSNSMSLVMYLKTLGEKVWSPIVLLLGRLLLLILHVQYWLCWGVLTSSNFTCVYVSLSKTYQVELKAWTESIGLPSCDQCMYSKDVVMKYVHTTGSEHWCHCFNHFLLSTVWPSQVHTYVHINHFWMFNGKSIVVYISCLRV
jgi:hypothetical protein